MKAGWWKSQLNPISMQNKRCPEPKAEARVQIHAGSFGRRAPARCLPSRAAHAAFPKRAFPAIRPQGSRKEPCQLAAARDHSARSTAQGPSHITMDSCHQGWEPERRRSCFTCTLQLWMQSTIVFFQPCRSEGDFKVFSPHSHRVRVSPCVTELNFGSKLGIYTAGNNIQEGVDDMKLLIDHDVIHWEAHLTLWVKTASLKKKRNHWKPQAVWQSSAPGALMCCCGMARAGCCRCSWAGAAAAFHMQLKQGPAMQPLVFWKWLCTAQEKQPFCGSMEGEEAKTGAGRSGVRKKPMSATFP